MFRTTRTLGGISVSPRHAVCRTTIERVLQALESSPDLRALSRLRQQFLLLRSILWLVKQSRLLAMYWSTTGPARLMGRKTKQKADPLTLLVLAQNADAGVEAKGARQMMSKSKLGNYSVLNESLQRLIMSRSLRPRQCSPAAGVLREARRRSLTSRLLGLPHSPAAGFLREACLLTKSPALGPTSPRSSLRYLHPLLRAPSRRTDHQGRTPASGTTSVSSITPSGPAIRASLPRASRPPTMPAPHGLLGNAHLFSTRLLIPSFHKARSSPKTPTGGNLPFSLASTSIPAP